MKKQLIVLGAMLLLPYLAFADPERVMMDKSESTLGTSAAYNSSPVEATSYKYLVVTVTSDQDSAVSGVKIEQSCDDDCDSAVSPTYHYASDWSYTAGSTDNQYVAELSCKCARVSYTNGIVPQTSFNITSYLKLN
ncbi:MAG: hypothetical protein DHS20C13_02750 [Thermodesulfobacteriota bacterium]|nr:MAG: hypothetical protein DHS20C13_02750 [Thermodesulfobacteriota bacterium]